MSSDCRLTFAGITRAIFKRPDTRNLKRPDFAVALGYIHRAIRHGLVPACDEVFPYCLQKGNAASLLDVRKRPAIDAWRASLPLGSTVICSRVSIVVTCTKRPQKRCDFADFAFRYIRRRRSCRLIGAFVISPLPHFAERIAHRSGPFPSGRGTRRHFDCGHVGWPPNPK
jgi:hypothetical protein